MQADTMAPQVGCRKALSRAAISRMSRATMSLVLVLLIQALAVAPVAFVAARRQDALGPVALLYTAALAVLLFGWTATSPSTPDLPAHPPQEEVENASALEAEDCARILQVTDELGVLGEITDGRVVARQQVWTQLPEQVQTAIAACLSQTRNSGEPVEIVVE